MRLLSLVTLVLVLALVYAREPRGTIVLASPAPPVTPVPRLGPVSVRHAILGMATDDCVELREIPDDSRMDHIPITAHAAPSFACVIVPPQPGTHTRYLIADVIEPDDRTFDARVIRIVPARDADDAAQRARRYEGRGLPPGALVVGP